MESCCELIIYNIISYKPKSSGSVDSLILYGYWHYS